MFSIEDMLLKKGVRTDSVWAHPRIFRSRLRLIPLFLDTFALLKSQYWPRERLDALVDARLKQTLSSAVNVPFWKKVIEHSDTDTSMSVRDVLRSLPVTKKQTLTQCELSEIADVRLLVKSDADHTSGSTGKPFHFYQDWFSQLRSYAITERTFRTMAPKRYPIVYMRARERHGFTFYRHVWFFLRGFSSIRHRMDAIRELGLSLKGGFILYGYTSWVVELARHMEKLGIRLPIRVAVVAGEHLTQADREYVERVMDTELYTLYASREVGFLGFECPLHHMHLNEEWAYVEIVDAEGKPLPYGTEGRIVVTTFDNTVMPFIRYELGDVGSISDALCACGRSLRVLSFKGRTSELIELADDRVVSLLDIAYSLGSYRDSIRHYQIIQRGKMLFTLKVVPGPSFETNKEFIETMMVRLLHPSVEISWELTEEIPESASGKAAYFLRDFL